MAKKELSPAEVIKSHIPKKMDKYKIIVKDAEFFDELTKDETFDMKLLDTINDNGLVNAGYDNDEFDTYDRVVVSKAKEPTTIDESRGIVVSKQLITKADKKLQSVGIHTFSYQNDSYVMVKFVYEKFDIVEIFLLVE